jgi:DNA adenine methylase
MGLPHPFPYQGSKRKLAKTIVEYIPTHTQRIIEPFAGSGAVSIAAIYQGKLQRVLINDANRPLMDLWQAILESPNTLADEYEMHWQTQVGQEKAYYNYIRDRFNQNHDPACLLFLLLRCVKAAVRYNAEGKFNQSPDNRRYGTRPDKIRQQLNLTAHLMRGKTEIKAVDYREILENLTPTDFVYLDPPYQGVVGTRDPRYHSHVVFDEFVETLNTLNDRCIPYLVSYDGRTGNKKHGNTLPDFLELKHLEIDAGRSSQATLLGKSIITYESLYLSPWLITNERISIPEI